MNEVIYFAIACGALALLYGLITAKSVISSDAGYSLQKQSQGDYAQVYFPMQAD